MATSGKISARNPLERLSSDVWFAIITQTAAGNSDFKVNLDTLKAYMADTAESAYDLAVKAGFTGTQAEWLESLKGASAYQIAVASGEYNGTLEQWMACMRALYTVDPQVSGQVLVAGSDRAVWRQLTKDLVGLDQVDNTADMDKPISTLVQQALDGKMDVDALDDEVVAVLRRLGFTIEGNDATIDEGLLDDSETPVPM